MSGKGGLLAGLWRMAIPARCLLCHEIGVDTLCESCLPGIEPIEPHCLRCGRKRITRYASPDCGECHGAKLGVMRSRSALVYNTAGRDLLAEYKFIKRDSAGAWLAQRLRQFAACGSAELYGGELPPPELVVPVPIHSTRRRERGFNQSELLAEAAGHSLDLPCRPAVLERTRATPSQVGLSAAKRQANVRGAFAVPEQPRWRGLLAGRCVLLVDDLMTTGATLRACALALRRGGAKCVLGLTLFSTTRELESALPPQAPPWI